MLSRTRGSARARAPLRQASFALFVAGILAYGAAFAWYLLDRFDLVNLVRDVNEDDSFYYFQIAWHMAGGEFSTFDGGLTRTNGYHPLWLFLITPFYWVFDKTEALFAIKAFEIMLVAGGVALAAGAARVARLPWILLFAALPALYGNPALFLGLEAAAGLFLLGLFLLAVCLFARDPGRWRWPLAAVAFALPWVRLEYVAVAVAATAGLCLVEWSDRLPSTLSGEGRGLSVDGPSPRARRGGWSGWGRSVLALNAAAPLSGAVAGILAYFAWNGVVFGGIVPVSAAAKQWISQLHWERGDGYSLPGNVLAFLRTGFFDYELLIALEVCVYAGLVWWFSRRSRGRDDWLLLAFLVGVFGLAAGHLAKFAQVVLTMHPGVSWRYDWYFVPAYLMEALVVPARCYVAIWFVRRFRRPDSHLAFRIPGSGIVAVGAVFLFATMDSAAPFRFVDSRMDLVDARNGMVSRLLGLMVMDRVLPGDSVVGTGGSGVMGYFSRFPVVNLDGLVNSWDYLRARKEGTAAAFLPRYGIDHLATNARSPRETLLFERNFPRAPGDTMLFEGTPRANGRRFWLWSVESPGTSWSGVDRAAWFWERMEPHVERQADGVGLLVDGRLAQAFARDCADEVVTWTWAGQEERVFMPWTQTSIGFCVSAVVLPHDALPPVRATTLTADEYLADRVGERRPAIDSDFDVHLVENRLVYVKEPCGPDDVAAPLFLRVYPVVPDDLPVRRQRRGYEEFRIATRAMMDAACVVEFPLPEYGIAAIRTGQHVAVEGGYHNLWEGEIRLGPD